MARKYVFRAHGRLANSLQNELILISAMIDLGNDRYLKAYRKYRLAPHLQGCPRP